MICVCKNIIPKNNEPKKRQIDLPTYARVVHLTQLSFIYQGRGKGEVGRSQSYNVAKMPRMPPGQGIPIDIPLSPAKSFIVVYS